ncbi:uncharacterized protein LOC122241912 [Panthera tigris]|uniref:uncharacterized protein LOC122241912 n=1 Tax=Panthera tigris TaxID=9694 RepID=UPI001C6F62D3|nr:uncharacterized protein LOC122241912 [Panthera tigris]
MHGPRLGLISRALSVLPVKGSVAGTTGTFIFMVLFPFPRGRNHFGVAQVPAGVVCWVCGDRSCFGELPTLQPQPEASGEKPSSTSSSDPGESSPTSCWLCKLRGHQKRRVNAGQDAASGRRQGWKDQGERIREGIKPSGTQREKSFPFTCESQWLMKVSRPRLYRAESDSRSSSCRLNGLHEELTVVWFVMLYCIVLWFPGVGNI